MADGMVMAIWSALGLGHIPNDSPTTKQKTETAIPNMSSIISKSSQVRLSCFSHSQARSTQNG